MLEQRRASSRELVLPGLVFKTEKELWPNEPGIIFDPESHHLIKELLGVINPLLDKGQTLKSLGLELKVGKVVYATLRPPRGAWTWFKIRDGDDHLIQIADWVSQEEKKIVLAHELSHVALGSRPETKGFLFLGVQERPPEMEEKYRLIERVCNWGAGYILSRVEGTGYISL